MGVDPFEELKEAPYELFSTTHPYSFDLNEDMIKTLRLEFNPEGVASRLAAASSRKPLNEIEDIGRDIFADYGRRWMLRVMELGEEYPDRTIEVALEAVDRNGKQFLFFPHVPQRFIEIAYLSIQKFLRLPITVNSRHEIAYRVPGCQVFNQVREKCGEEVAGLMTCRNACFTALGTLCQGLVLEASVNMTAAANRGGYCEFSLKKL